MARGVDIWAAEIVLKEREHNPAIKLICASPYKGFERSWSSDWKKRYNDIMDSADLVRFICPGYSRACFQIRNEWMVDHSARVEDVLFISMDGVSGLEEGARSIFKDVIVQRCIVHLIRNSVKYIPSKDYKTYTAQLRKVYGASSLKAAEAEFERFKQAWSQYPGAVDVWIRNWKYVEQLFNYGSAVRRVMYTTNAIESVNSSFRKVTKKGSFPSEEAVRKALYLRITELYKKWNGRPVSNWAMVRNGKDHEIRKFLICHPDLKEYDMLLLYETYKR